ncbi:MAG: phosphatidylinositol-specific phospholipase C domain-containing protein [Prevotella sp.]|nr:phosphatidylinositol-specific phospholipase C domain-containing protein [Prevotella sp.]
MKNRKLIIFGMAMLATSCMVVPKAQADNWMSRLDDNAYVMQLSIPGTHDAATGDGFEWGAFADAFGKTQELSLAEQWAAGVRAFDLRPSVVDDDLVICHGILTTNTRFADALRLISDSLKANPSETAIILMRHESDNGSSLSTWKQLTTELLNSDEVRAMVVDFKPRLTLGDVRGKMLIASRDAYDSTPVGAFITNWSHSASFDNQKNARIRGPQSGTTTTLYAQDYYDLTATNGLKKKTDAIKALLDFSTRVHQRSILSNVWIINHCSGYTVSASTDGIRECAATTNRLVADYLADEAHWGPTGIVMMDFAGIDRSGDYEVAGAALLQAIIDNNFRYEAMSAGIEVTEREKNATPSATYDLLGRKLSEHGRQQQGIVISNGKKHLAR